MLAIDRELTGDKQPRVHLEVVPTHRTRTGRPGKKQRWVVEVGEPTDAFALIGRGRTIKEAIANLGPRAYEMDFDPITWKMRHGWPGWPAA